jgi:transcriptional regulator with XRE-family HTH domain
MSDHIASIRAQLWQKMRNPDYREAFVSAHLSTNIAAQITTLRESQPEPWTKAKLAEKTGMARARISVLENPSYDKHSLSTLKRLAKAFDVALVVRFEAYSTLVRWVADLTPEKMAVPSFNKDSLNEPIPQPLQETIVQNRRRISKTVEIRSQKSVGLFGMIGEDVGSIEQQALNENSAGNYYRTSGMPNQQEAVAYPS